MRKIYMQNSHYPDQNEHGDCLRACVASLFDLEAADVPHFGEDGSDGPEMWRRVNEWAKPFKLRTWITVFPGDTDLDALLAFVKILNGDTHYLVGGYSSSGGGDHIVVAQGDRIIHDPSRMGSGIQGPSSDGVFHIVTFVRDFN